MYRKLFCLLPLVLLIAACSSEEKTKEASSTLAAEDIAAVVNGEPISVESVARVAVNFAQGGLQPDPDSKGATRKERLYYTAAERMVEQTLVVQETAKLGLTVTEEEVAGSLAQLKAMTGGEEGFQKILDERNITIDAVLRDMRMNLLMRKFYDHVNSESPVTEEEVTKYYEENPDQFAPKPQVRARHVLIRVTPGMDEFARAEAKRRAEEVLQKAREGADFGELAGEYTEDPSGKQSGGDLGWFGRGAMVPAFDSTAFALEPGELSDIVLTQFGYHVIKLEEKRLSESQELTQVRATIESQISQQRFKEAVSALRSGAEIEVHPPRKETLEEIPS